MSAGECRRVQSRFEAYLAGELTPESGRKLEKHLASCPLCREELEAERLLRRALSARAEQVPGSEYFAAFFPRLRGRLSGPVARPVPSLGRIPRPAWGMGLAAAAVLALLVLVDFSGSSSALAPPASGPPALSAEGSEIAEADFDYVLQPGEVGAGTYVLASAASGGGGLNYW